MKRNTILALTLIAGSVHSVGFAQSRFTSKEDSLDYMNRRRFWTSIRWSDVETTVQKPYPSRIVSDSLAQPGQISPTTLYTARKAIRIGSATTSEPHIAVSPTDPLNFICGYHRDTLGSVRVASSYTTNQGVTWINSDISTLWFLYSKQSDPVIAFDADGNAYYLYMDLIENSKNALVVMKSIDKGALWNERFIIVNESQPSTTTLNDKPWMACDQSGGPYRNNIYVTWTRFTNNTQNSQIYFARKRAGQSTFDNIQGISSMVTSPPTPPPGTTPELVHGSNVVVGNDGVVYMFWYRRNTTTGVGRLWWNKTTDGGATFTGEREVGFGDITQVEPYVVAANGTSRFLRAHSFPVATIRPSGGSGYDIFLAWTDYRNSKVDIYYSKSSDHFNWAGAQQLFHGGGIQRFLPAVTTNSSGQVFLAYYDRVNTLTNDIRCVVARSDDGGSTFVSAENAAGGDFDGYRLFTGDYIGIAANQNSYWAIWPGLVGGSGGVPYNNDIFGTYKAVYVTVRNELQGTSYVWYNGVRQESPHSTYDVFNGTVPIKASDPVPQGGNQFLTIDRWFNENNTELGRTQTITVTLNDNHTYRATFALSADVIVKNEFKEPSGTTSNGGLIYVDGEEFNAGANGQFRRYLSIGNHTLDAREQLKGSYWRGFNPRPDADGGWRFPSPTAPPVYQPLINPVVETGQYLAKFRNRYDVNLIPPVFVEPASGSVLHSYIVNGADRGNSWLERTWQYENVSLESRLTGSEVEWVFSWNDGSQQNPRQFSPPNNATLQGHYKANMRTSNSQAYATGGQRKVMPGWVVYESAGSIWLQGTDGAFYNNARPLNWQPAKSASLSANAQPVIAFQEVDPTDPNYTKIMILSYSEIAPPGTPRLIRVDSTVRVYNPGQADLFPNVRLSESLLVLLWTQNGTLNFKVAHAPLLNGGHIMVNWLGGNVYPVNWPLLAEPAVAFGEFASGSDYLHVVYHGQSPSGGSGIFYQKMRITLNGYPLIEPVAPAENISKGNGAYANTKPAITAVGSTVYASWTADYCNCGGYYSMAQIVNLGAPGVFRNYAYPVHSTNLSTIYDNNYVATDYVFAWSEGYPGSALTGRYILGSERVPRTLTDQSGAPLTPNDGIQLTDGSPSSPPIAVGVNSQAPLLPQLVVSAPITTGAVQVDEPTEMQSVVSTEQVDIFFGISDVAVDGQRVGFEPLADTVQIRGRGNPHRYLMSKPFTASAGSTLGITLGYGASDSVRAAQIFRAGRRVAFSPIIVDARTEQALARINPIVFQRGSRLGARRERIELPMRAIQNRLVRLRWEIDENLGADYSIVEGYGSDSSRALGKASGALVVENMLPLSFALHPNYPNPFNPSTQINYDLPEPATVSLVIHDVLGRKVAELVNGTKEAGYHSATWNASSVASGVYFARFTATDANGSVRLSKVTKLLLTK